MINILERLGRVACEAIHGPGFRARVGVCEDFTIVGTAIFVALFLFGLFVVIRFASK